MSIRSSTGTHRNYAFVNMLHASESEDEGCSTSGQSCSYGSDYEISGSSQEESDVLGQFEASDSDKKKKKGRYCCPVCRKRLRKPAYLKEHLRVHTGERPFVCPAENCDAKYKRKHHLDRHMAKHEGSVFKCHWPSCKLETTSKSNFERHLKRHFMKGELQRHSIKEVQYHVCKVEGCSKRFRFLSGLKYHQETHECKHQVIMCGVDGCCQTFDSSADLQDHMRVSHKYAHCESCGVTFLRKQGKRHFETHTPADSRKRVRCSYPGCLYSYTKKSNLEKHVKVVHLELKPYACEKCGNSFAYRHVKDNHEKVAHVPGNFAEYEKDESMLEHTLPQKGIQLNGIDDIFIRRSRRRKKQASNNKCKLQNVG